MLETLTTSFKALQRRTRTLATTERGTAEHRNSLSAYTGEYVHTTALEESPAVAPYRRTMDALLAPAGLGAAAEAEAALPPVPGATLAPSTTVSDVDSLSLRMLQRSLATEGDSKVRYAVHYYTTGVIVSTRLSG